MKQYFPPVDIHFVNLNCFISSSSAIMTISKNNEEQLPVNILTLYDLSGTLKLDLELVLAAPGSH